MATAAAAYDQDDSETLAQSQPLLGGAPQSRPSRRSRFVVAATALALIAALAIAISFAWSPSRPPPPDPLAGARRHGQAAANDDASPVLTNWTDIRLPARIHPTHYSLDILLHDFDVFSGTVTIDLVVEKPTQILVVHSRGLNLTSTSIVDPSHSAITPRDVAIDHIETRSAEDYSVIFLTHAIESGSVSVQIGFNGHLSHGLEGFYRAAYPVNDKPGSPVQYLATTHFEPTYARRAFPCLDQPDKKSVFDISVTAPKPFFALSNMPVRDVADLGNGYRRYVFDQTVKMSTYLVSFVVSDFEFVEGRTKNNVMVRVWTPPGRSYLGTFALHVAVTALEYYQDAFRIPYPVPKCDLISIPDFAMGAMENWGLITFRDTALLLDPATSSSSMRQRVAIVVAHELAHQWFGNLVTMGWWDDLWLNEGFAEFMEYKGTNAVYPEWRMRDQYLPSDLYRALNADESLFTHPIAVSVRNPDDIADLFDDISYGKGSAVLRMLESYLTMKRNSTFFFDGLSKYLTAHAYGNAVTNELWESLDPNGDGGVKLRQMMSTWTNQPGYPVVSVTCDAVDSDNGDRYFSIKQTRFLFSGLVDAMDGVNRSEIPPVLRVPNDTSGQMWIIPFVYRVMHVRGNKVVGRHDAQMYELDVPGPVRIRIPTDTKNENDDITRIVVSNYGKPGVYRVHYDECMLNRIITMLETDYNALDAVDRAGIMSDVFTMTYSGRIRDPTYALRVSRFLLVETDMVVWKSMVTEMWTMRKAFAHHPVYGMVVRYQRKLVSSGVAKLGWHEEKGGDDAHVRALMRGTMLQEAVRLDHTETVSRGIKYFKKLRKGELNIVGLDDLHTMKGVSKDKWIPTDALQAVLMAGVMHSDDKDDAYEWVLQKYMESTLAADKQLYLYALASATNSYLQMRTLELVLPQHGNPAAVRLQDVTSLIENVGSITPVGHLTVWNFLMSNWDAVTDLWRSTNGDLHHFNDLLDDAVGKFTNTYLISEAKRLFVEKRDPGFWLPPNSMTSILKGVETASQLLAWQVMATDGVTEWLTKELENE